MLKTYYYFKNHNMKYIENQCINNRVITLLFHSYSVDITINEMNIGMRVADAAHPNKKNP